MKLSTFDDLVVWGIAILIAVAAILGLVFATWEMIYYFGEKSDQSECSRRGGRIEYSPPPHEDTWRCAIHLEGEP